MLGRIGYRYASSEMQRMIVVVAVVWVALVTLK